MKKRRTKRINGGPFVFVRRDMKSLLVIAQREQK
jgi:hypothetical protein